jgi:uncharacterized membrane protein
MLPRARPPSEDQLGLERIVFFSDAVMAIAITLLALDIHVPELDAAVASQQLVGALAALAPRFITFFISFVVIAVYWVSHHRYFGYIRRYDTRLNLFNLVFLFFVICMPFLAGLLGRYVTEPVALVAYTLATAALGLSMAMIWWYSSHDHRLIAPEVDAATIRVINLRLFVAPVMFLLAVPFAYVSGLAVIIVWWLSPLAVLLATRLWGSKSAPRRPRRA